MSGAAEQPACPRPYAKRAGDAAAAARLRRERELLALAQLPGVVQLVALEGPPHDPVLVTARVDGPDLARVSDLSDEEVAAVVAEVAATLADLHELGVVHGAVLPGHVLLPPDGHPVLCGFGYGARAGEPPVAEAPLPAAAVDAARAEGAPLTPASDVLALGALLDTMLATAQTTPAGEGHHDALRALVARTSVAAPELRPSARAVAEAVRHAVPSARLPGRPRPGTDREPLARPPRAVPALAAMPAWRARGGANRPPLGRRRAGAKAVPVVLAALAVGALAVRATAGGSPPAPAPLTAPTPVTATAPPPPSTRAVPPSTTATAPSACPTAPGLLAADVDGDGCPEALRWEGGVVEAGGRRWSVGQPGDLAVAGDWACAGTATLAVLRPGTGQVFVFDGWATAGRDVTATAAARVDGAFALRAAEIDGDGCPDLVVERAGGPPAKVPRPAVRP